MNKKWKWITCFFSVLLILLGQSLIEAPSVQAKAGDDPGITINGPSTIGSRQQVELMVTLASSAGKLDKDGYIEVAIPKSVVANKSDILDKLVIDSPFALGNDALTEGVGGNYLLKVQYDHTKIDQASASGQTFTIKFMAPRFYGDDPTIPASVTFHDKLYKGNKEVSKDQAVSQIGTDNPGLPLLEKNSIQSHKTINGEQVALMSTTNPSTNIFAILVNYNRLNLKNAKIVDKTPKNTELANPGKYIPAKGDATPSQHIRIAKVTAWGEDGFPTAWTYVTNLFSEKITTSMDGFSIDLGDLTENDSYVIMYAEKIEDDMTASTFGVRHNRVSLLSEDAVIKTAEEPLAIDTSDYNYTSLTKKVDKPIISTAEGDLTYSLTLANMDGTVPAGTRIIDPLPPYITFDKTTEFNSHFISDATYDERTHTLSYTLLRDLTVGQKTTVKFLTRYSNPHAQAGNSIINKAYIEYAGTDIYSNSVTTTVENSAYLVKRDAETKHPLAGAVFKVVDEQGLTVLSELTSNEAGMIRTGILRPGNYSFIETKAPDGYLLDTKSVPFTIQYGDTSTVKLYKTNQLATMISGKKTWDDDHDKAGKRPSHITIDLYQNGKMMESKEVTEKDNWSYTFSQLPQFDSTGKLYRYELKEEAVDNYMTLQEGYNFTNVYVPSLPVPPTPPTPPIPPIPTTPVSPITPMTPDLIIVPEKTVTKSTDSEMATTPSNRSDKNTPLPATGDTSYPLWTWLEGATLLAVGILVLIRQKRKKRNRC